MTMPFTIGGGRGSAADFLAAHALQSGELGVADTKYPVGHPKRYGAAGDGAANDTVALQRAFASVAAIGADTVTLDGATYAVASTLTVPAGVRVAGGAIVARAGFVGNHVLTLAAGASLVDVTLNGANVPPPAGAWLGVASPLGSLVYADSVADVLLQRVTFEACPSGPVFLRSCARARLEACHASGVQTYTGAVTNGVWELYECDDARVVDCTVDGYNWKGVSLGNCERAVVRGARISGGTQNSGHAAHYEDGCTDCAWLDCSHAGDGYGFKSSNGTRTVVARYVADGSAGGIQFQGATHFQVRGASLMLAATSNNGVIVEGIASTGAAGPGLLDGVHVRRAVQGSGLSHVGLVLYAAAGYPVENLTVRDCRFENCYIGVWTAHAAGAEFSGLVLDRVHVIAPASYGFLLYPESVRVVGCRFERSGDGTPSILCYSASGVAGSSWHFEGNAFEGLTGAQEAAQLGYDGTNSFGTRVDSVAWRNNRSDGGGVHLRVDLSNSAGGAGTNYIRSLVVEGNVGRELASADALLLTFGTVQTTRLRVVGNSLFGTAGAMRNIAATNGAQVSGGVSAANDVAAFTGKPATLTAGL